MPPTLTLPAAISLPTRRVAVPPNLDLIRRYSIPGPRYTSYPPATQFTADLGSLRLAEAMASDNLPGAGPLSLYFHLPFCESLCWYCGCNTVITRRRSAAAEYLEGLAREVELTAAQMDRSRPVTQIHFGGGTPTFFPPDELRRLGALIRDTFNVDPLCEIGVEIDPRRLVEEHVTALREIGANRASLGVQDVNPAVQIAIHRFQPHRLNQQAMKWLRGAGFASINIDLIYGLPLQTADSFARTLDDVLSMEPDRLSVFSYAHVPWVRPAQKILERNHGLPGSDEKLAMFAVAHAKLTEAGYLDIGLDHFARPDDELAAAQRDGSLQRNFQGYSTKAGSSLYGFGVSAISSTPDSYRQNYKTLAEWNAALAEGRLPIERGLRLTEDDGIRRSVIMHLMCERRLNFAAISRELDIDFSVRFADELASLVDLEEAGLVERVPEGLEVTSEGAPLLRVIAMRFDAYLSPGTRRHSQTI